MGLKNEGTFPEGGLVHIWFVLNFHANDHNPAISLGEAFVLDSFNLNFEVLYVALLFLLACLKC